MSEDALPDGLSNISDVEALADQFSACADALHTRLLHDIKTHRGDYSDAEQAQLRALFDDEQVLRQRANALYTDAAAATVPTLGLPQQQLISLTATAAEQIRKIGMVGEVLGLVGGLLSLAGAVASGHVAGIVKAFEQVRTHGAGVAAHRPATPTAPAAPAAPAKP